MKRIIPVIALVIFLASGSAWAAEAELGVDFNSAYVWRGITYNDGWVAQPSLTVSNNGFSLNVWGNYDIDDYDGALDDNDFSEIDLTASYTFTGDTMEFTLGVTNYLFPGSAHIDDPSTTELFVGLLLKMGGGWSVGATYYYDVDEVDSYYADFALTYAAALTNALDMELGARIGYAGSGFADYHSGGTATDGGFYDYGFSFGLTYKFTDAVSVGAFIYYVDSADKDVLPDAMVDTDYYGGVNISFTF
jgi:hypothetical protein